MDVLAFIAAAQTVAASHASASFAESLVRIGFIVVGCAGFLATGYAIVRTNLTSQTISNLSKNNAALQERMKLIEETNVDLKVLLRDRDGVLHKRAEEMSLLRDQVSGTTAVAKLTDIVVQNQASIMKAIGELREICSSS